MTRIKEALDDAARALAAVSPTAGLDARILLEHVLSRDQAWLIAHGADPVGAAALERFRAMVVARLEGEPVAYITGWKAFWSLRLAVDEAVLIPRPETEHLVEQALALIPERDRRLVADLGTGSGAAALAIARERPRCDLVATDISDDALRVAKANARRTGARNVRFLRGDWFGPLGDLSFDVIVSNPPYVADHDPCLGSDGVRREPELALRAGPTGLDALEAIAAGAGRHLKPGGWLLVEHGCDQQRAVRRILEQGGLRRIVCHRDHAGHPRVSAGQRPRAA